MSSKRFVSQKTYKEVYDKKKQLSYELSVLESNKVSIPELERRILNIPNLQNVLKTDSILNKRRFKR